MARCLPGIAVLVALSSPATPVHAQLLDAPPPARTTPTIDAEPAVEQKVAPEKLLTDLHETIARVPVTVALAGGKLSGEMIVTHYRPQGDGPFPIVIMNHGRSAARKEMTRSRSAGSVRFWTRRGFAVFVPTRLGYGDSGAVAQDPDGAPGSCDRRSYGLAMRNMLVQIEATLGFARTTGFVDDKRVIVMGQSYGGLASIGASGHPIPGLIGAVNFSGGGGGSPKDRPMNPCGAAQLTELVAAAGTKAKVPMLWLYAENDRYWGAEWPRKWHAAYVKAGGRADLVMLPPVGEDGHKMIGEGFRLWRPHVERYLVGLGFQQPRSQDPPSASGFAPLEAVDRVPFITAKGRELYAKFLDGDLPRAFAVAPSGASGYSRSSGPDAPQRALDVCNRHAQQPCLLYAVDDAVVWVPAAAAAAP